jgi:hypothetical protein
MEATPCFIMASCCPIQSPKKSERVSSAYVSASADRSTKKSCASFRNPANALSCFDPNRHYQSSMLPPHAAPRLLLVVNEKLVGDYPVTGARNRRIARQNSTGSALTAHLGSRNLQFQPSPYVFVLSAQSILCAGIRPRCNSCLSL